MLRDCSEASSGRIGAAMIATATTAPKTRPMITSRAGFIRLPLRPGRVPVYPPGWIVDRRAAGRQERSEWNNGRTTGRAESFATLAADERRQRQPHPHRVSAATAAGA